MAQWQAVPVPFVEADSGSVVEAQETVAPAFLTISSLLNGSKW